MSTKTHYFTGPCKWAKLKVPDEYRGEKKWKVNVYLTKDSQKLLKQTGVPLKLREDDDGIYVTFSRPTEKTYNRDGKDETVQFSPPKVFDGELNEIDDLIGNGSIITAKVSVFPDKGSGPSHRLEAVRVDKLVKYEEKTEEEVF